MGAVCSTHSGLDPSYGSCATLHGDWRKPQTATDQRARDHARRMAAALTAYADGMHAASIAEAADDEVSARHARAEARASLHAYPALRALVA